MTVLKHEVYTLEQQRTTSFTKSHCDGTKSVRAKGMLAKDL